MSDNTFRWYKDRGLRSLNFRIALLYFGSSAGGYDGSMISSLFNIGSFFAAMSPLSTQMISLLVVSQFLGGIAGFILAAPLPDRVGRRPVVIGSALMLVAFSIGQAFSRNKTDFIATRFFIGVSGMALNAASPTLITEIAHPRQRGPLSAIYNTMFYSGSIVVTWLAFGTLNLESSWAWRAPVLCQAFLPCFSILGGFLAPESPRWLVARDRTAEAHQILARYHGNGDLNDVLVLEELAMIETHVENEKLNQTGTFKGLVATKPMRKRMLIIAIVALYSQWSGNNIITYYFPSVLKTVGITNPTNVQLINGGLQIWNLFIALSAALSVDRLGRRTLFLISAFGMLSSYVAITALSATFAKTGNPAPGEASIAFLFLFNGFYSVAFSPLGVAYPVEILPYAYRAKGMACVAVLIYIALVFNVYVNPIALAALEWKYYLVYVAVLVCLVPLIYFLFPETRGLPLEQIARCFGDELEEPGQVSQQGVYEFPSRTNKESETEELEKATSDHIE